MVYLVGLEELPQILFQYCPFCLQIIYVVCDRLRRYEIVELVAFAQVELDKPRR